MYWQPTTLEDAVGLLMTDRPLIVGGATDIYARNRLAHRAGIVDLSRLAELQKLEVGQDEVRIGSGVTWSRLRDACLPAALAGLKSAAATVGGAHIQSRATLGGNICNASPAADGVPPLLAAGASLEFASTDGRRRVALHQAYTPDGRLDRRADELLSAVLVPLPQSEVFCGFEKLGLRKASAISVVNAAMHVELEPGGGLHLLRIAVGAASQVPMRLVRMEARLMDAGRLGLLVPVAPGDLMELAPITDIRASASYRLHAAAVLLNRLASRLAARMEDHDAKA